MVDYIFLYLAVVIGQRVFECILKNGVYVSGGTSQINNLEQFIKQETNLNVNIVDQPSESVVRGLIGVVNNPQFSKVAYTPQDKNYD